MSKYKIRWIIALMSFAMIGLVSYQAYWITNAIKINETRFQQNVHKALNSVVANLEKSEIFYTAQRLNDLGWQQHMFYEDSDWYQLNTPPGSGKPFYKQSNLRGSGLKQKGAELIFEDSVFFGHQKIKISYQLGENYFMVDTSRGLPGHPVYQNRFEINMQSIPELDQQLKTSIQKFARKSQMVNAVLNELMSGKKDISKRIDKKELEKLLDTELKNLGINLNYEYAVINGENDQFIFSEHREQDRKNILTSDLSVRLYPGDMSGDVHFLTIYFPQKTGFLLKEIWVTLTSSLFLMALIIFSFAYSLFAIIRQKKLSEIKNDFINNMTHEFKTPISTVALACEALQDNEIKKNNSFFNNYVRVIREENERLQRQVEKVLQMATLDKNEFKLKWEHLDIHQVIDKAIDHINLQVLKRGGKIEKHYNAENNLIRSDEVHLTNIISNLLDNANKYSQGSPEIDIHTDDHHQGLLIRINDKGIGMTRDEINKIFDKFYRVPTGNLHDVKGFGLGLTYVKTMVYALGGHVKVKSIPGTGSTFEIVLPLKNGQDKSAGR